MLPIAKRPLKQEGTAGKAPEDWYKEYAHRARRADPAGDHYREHVVMIKSRTIHATFLVGCLALPAAGPALAQGGEPERVPLIMTKLPPQNSPLYKRIIKHAGKAKGQVLTLTKTEMWAVPKENVEAVKKAAAAHGVGVNQLGEKWNHLFHKAPSDMTMDDKQKTMMEQAKSSRSTVSIGMMETPMAPMVEYALTKDHNDPTTSRDPARISVAVNDKTTLTVTRSNVDVKPNMCIWRGTVDGTGAPVTIMWWPGGKMTGTLQHEGRIYSFRHMGGDMHAVVEMAEDRMPQEHAPMPERIRANDPNLRDDPLVNEGDGSQMRPKKDGKRSEQKGRKQAKLQQAKATADQKVAALGDGGAVGKKAGAAKSMPSQKDVVIDVIVAYTKKAAANYSDVKRELVELAMEEANESFRQSGVGHVKLRLVHTYQTDYAEEPGSSHFDHVWAFADKGDGKMEEIHALREKHKADVGILIVDDPKGCGLATRVYADADEAFAVVHHECAATSYTLAHEVGHLIGARHDLNLDKNLTPFPYGHGFVNGTKWRDIMSYKESCNGCPRLPIWSSPLIKVRGDVAGAPDLDNARVIREQAGRVAAFR